MSRYTLLLFAAGLALFSQPASAQSASYHLERLQIQARAFLASLAPAASPTVEGQINAEQQLQASSNSAWSQQMVADDVNKLLETGAQMATDLREATPDELLAAKSTLRSLASRLRVSTAALNLSPDSKTHLDFMMLELEESANVMELQREQLQAQAQQQRRQRTRIGVGVGYGWGGGWGAPYGWGGGWGGYPYGYGFRGHPGFVGGGRVYGVGPRGRR